MTSSTVDPLVVFSPSGRRGRFARGTNVLQAARTLGVDLDSVCGGRAICGRCQVQVAEGEMAKHGIVSRAARLTAPGEAEIRFAEKRGLGVECRLGCQAVILDDVVIDIPASSQVHRQVVRKQHEAHDIEVDPIVRPYFVDVDQPDMHNPSGDFQRLLLALKTVWRLDGLICALPVVQTLQRALRAGNWQVTVAVRGSREIIAVWPGFRDHLYGVAVDVGSSTIGAELCQLASGEIVASAGCMNPQIRFGEDLMSRVSYIMANPGREAELTRVVRLAISELVAEVAAQAGIEIGDIVEMTVVGNPIMQHLVLGIDPIELGKAPFALASDAAHNVPARELDIVLNAGAYVYTLPCIAGHVGADAAGVLLAEAPDERDEISLVIDVGTNAEILLGNRERILAASSPTGPAFEGAQIGSGQRAAPGAIERVRIDRGTLEPRFKVVGCDLWSDEPGFADMMPSCGVTGICGSGIIEAVAEMYLAGIITADGLASRAMAARSPRIVGEGRTFTYVLCDGEPGVRIRQNDVRAIQLAKAALYAGVRLLMERFGVQKVDRIRLAGAFGAQMDVKYAMVLGMIPDCRLEQVSSAGNAAGTGARIALLDRKARAAIEKRVRRVEKIETAIAADFQRHFVAAMVFPNQSDVFSELSKRVDLPTSAAKSKVSSRRRPQP